MEKTRLKIKSESFYCIFFACFILYWLLDVTLIKTGLNYSWAKLMLLLIGGFSFLIHWINTIYTPKELFKQLVLFAIILCTFIFSGMQNTGFLIIFPAIVGLKNVHIKEVVKVMFWTMSIYLFVFILLCFIKILPSDVFMKKDAFGNVYKMITFGNQHGNTIYVVWFNILCSYIYAYYDKLKKSSFLYLTILSIIMYLLLYSRTGIILSIIVLILSYIVKFTKITLPEKLNKITSFLIKYSYLIFYITVFSIAAFLHETEFFTFLNNLVSSRIAEVRHYLIDIGFGLFPQKIIYYWICDNTQIKILVSYGLIFTSVYLIYSIKTIQYLLKKNLKIEIVMMLMYLLYSYSEVAFFKPISDFTMLFFSYAIFESYYKSENKSKGNGESIMDKIKNSIKTGNFFEKIFCYILMLLGFSNDRIQVMEVRCKKYNFIKKKYFDKIDLNKYNKKISNEDSENIWFCWLQGKDEMPKIVKSCYDRIIKFHSDKKIQFIDSKNYSNFIELPKYIIEKWESGIISPAHFSDIIRTAILAEKGGLWIDATTYLTSPIPKYIFESKMFMFDMRTEDDIMIYNNWFIYTRVNNRVFEVMRDYLYLFWKHENKVHEYFIWHLFMRHVYEEYPEDFKDMIYIPHECTHMLIKNLNEEYDKKYYNITNEICSIQKLTYKNIDTNKKNSLYSELIKKGEENE